MFWVALRTVVFLYLVARRRGPASRMAAYLLLPPGMRAFARPVAIGRFALARIFMRP